MKAYRLCLVGFGNIARQLTRILLEREAFLQEKHRVHFAISAICEREGVIFAPSGSPGICAKTLLSLIENPSRLSSVPGFESSCRAEEAIHRAEAEIMIELTPTEVNTGEPALTHILAAFEHGMHVVTANKGPLVAAYSRVLTASQKANKQLKFGCATAAALPTTNVGYYDLAGCDISAIEGILNGTSNYILSRMHMQGDSYEAALLDAQRMGIAEKDPTLDVQGFDTAVKLVILANALMDAGVTLDDVEREGINDLTSEQIDAALIHDRIYKLIGRAEKDTNDGKVRLRVAPQLVERDHPLYNVTGTAKAVAFTTDLMGTLLVAGGNSSPAAAAAAILRDLINLAREDRV